jgi:hypothetical protein
MILAAGVGGCVAIGCGDVVRAPGRDMDTPPYLEVVSAVPSFWTEDASGGITVTFYLRDDRAPEGMDPEAIREVLAAAVATWLEPLEETGRNVRLPIIWASRGLPPPVRHVEVVFVERGEAWLGATRYHTNRVEVEVSVKPMSLDRFLKRRELLALAIHEIGHSLGISQPGHSLNANDVMFGHDLENDWITLSKGDRAVILSLFPD